MANSLRSYTPITVTDPALTSSLRAYVTVTITDPAPDTVELVWSGTEWAAPVELVWSGTEWL